MRELNEHQFRVPKQTDTNVLMALAAIRDGIADEFAMVIQAYPPGDGPAIVIPDKEPEKAPAIQFVVKEQSQVLRLSRLIITHQPNHATLSIERRFGEIADVATIEWGSWAQIIPPEKKAAAYVRLKSLALKHLRAFELEASFYGAGDQEWTRYRDSQQAILHSLQETLKSVVSDFARRSLDAENAAGTKLKEKDEQLAAEFKAREKTLADEHARRMKGLDEREGELRKRDETFNTQEARYVARQEQRKQIDDIKKWLDGWNLTRGTQKKRWPVAAGYVCALLATGSFTIWFSVQNFDILKQLDPSKVAWWQWVLLSLKSILPFAAFTTFLVYVIRWSSSWARQHSEEEFLNRTRVVDIGRASWLLEAVRDAQDHKQEIPAALLKDLSHNLFALTPSSDGSDAHPKAAADVLMQGLNSIRVKSADGTEVEASRGGKKH